MAQKDQDPKPTETDVQNTPEQAKNLDHDGRERYPNEQTDDKT